MKYHDYVNANKDMMHSLLVYTEILIAEILVAKVFI